jgi:hypothetical protein
VIRLSAGLAGNRYIGATELRQAAPEPGFTAPKTERAWSPATKRIVSIGFRLAQQTTAPAQIDHVQNEQPGDAESKIDYFDHYESPLTVCNP